MKEEARAILAFLQDNTVSARDAFKTLIGSVELEISSACNRRCVYCPQSILAREQELMPLELFRKIVLELHGIDYGKDISFHQFNEPLLAVEHLYACMRTVKECLPAASMNIFTNGDPLTPEVLEQLRAHGAASVVATCHYAKNEAWSVKSAFGKIAALCARLGLPFNIQPVGHGLTALASVGETEVWISSSDLLLHGSHRLGTVPAGEREQTHDTLCAMMLSSMNIAYSGTAYLCCEFCHGIAEQQQYALGNARGLTVFELLERKKKFVIAYLSGNRPACCRNCRGN